MGDRIQIRCQAVKYVLCYCNPVKGVVQTAVFCFPLKCLTADICSKWKIFRRLPIYEKVTFCLSSNIQCILVCHICSWLRSCLSTSLQPMWQTSVWESWRAVVALRLVNQCPSLSLWNLSLCLFVYITYAHTHKIFKVWVELIFSPCLDLATLYTYTLSSKMLLLSALFVFCFIELESKNRTEFL